MNELIQNTIDWKKLSGHSKDAYSFSLEKVKITEDGSSITLEIRLNFVVPFDDHLKICASLKNKMPDLKDVKIKYIYDTVILDTKEIISLFIEHMIGAVNGSFASITKTILTEEFELDDDELVIFAVGQVAVNRLNKDIAGRFADLLENDFGITRKVVFKNQEDIYKKAVENIRAQEQRYIEENEKRQAEAKARPKEATDTQGGNQSGNGGYGGKGGGNWRRKPKEDPVVGNKIMGPAIKTAVTPLGEVAVELGKVAVEGILFSKEERAIREGTKLIKLLITDQKTSLCIKAFVSDKKWEDIDTNLKEGDFIKVQGDAEWDTYENVLIVMGKSIEKGEAPKREDTSEEKRTELHAHTKMSAMDGLSDTTALIKQAAAWGHKAIAITDHGVVQSFPDAAHAVYGGSLKEKVMDIKVIYGVEAYLYDDKGCIDEDGNIDYKAHGYNHAIILAKDYTGLKNLYKLISISHLDYIYKKPRMPKSIISKHREGLILGSACEAGEVFRGITSGASEEELAEKVAFYDYLEIQPLINNRFMIKSDKHPNITTEEDLKDLNRRVIELGEKYGKPVVATCDTHYINEEDGKYREILLVGQGYKDVEGGLYFRTTDEMLEEFAYLGEEKAHEIVIENSNAIADQIEEIIPIAKGKFPPKIENAEETLKVKCYERAAKIYGDPLPEFIQKRLDKELDSIIGNGYAVMYVSAEMLVQKSLSDGFLVGSRGSVGSSFAATMAGITEVNPLPPHYICPNCRHLEWGDEKEYDCGVDMPEKICPECSTKMNQDGFAIPFETFLGFEGDKEPDIDLNFAGEYQAKAHKYVDEIFGGGNVFKAGTIGTMANKTAYGFVRKYFDEKQIPVNKFETERLLQGCVGVKRTTGQHPGGIIIVPEGHEIYEFCPVQHPANDAKSDIITTHFDYHSIDQNLLKLDILGHDAPSMIRQLQDLTGVDPLTVPLKDERVNGIFNGTEGLDIKDPNYKFTHGSYGIPEFGTKFVRQMLDDTKPTRFGDLVRISGFSHGTNVWLNNAQEFIRAKKATMKDAISTRDDIMNYLILKGLPNGKAFKIMEKVRKGKGVSEENVELMKKNDVPEWYIESCQRISYMFPRAHAVAYVIMSYRIAYYKVYYPVEFYAVSFTTKISDFNWDIIKQGPAAILKRIDEVQSKGKNATNKEIDEVIPMELAYEMYSRGYEFEPPNLDDSKAIHFTVKDGKVLIPLCALAGVGESAGRAIEEEYKKKKFGTIEEMRDRGGINKTAVEALRENGVLDGMPESDQLSLF